MCHIETIEVRRYYRNGSKRTIGCGGESYIGVDESISAEGSFPTQPATLYIVPTMTLIHKNKYILRIVDRFSTGFLLFFSKFQAL